MNYDEFKGDDLEYYEQFVLKLSEDEQLIFFKEHPDFLGEYSLNPLRNGKAYLLKDEIYRGIMRKVKLLNC